MVPDKQPDATEGPARRLPFWAVSSKKQNAARRGRARAPWPHAHVPPGRFSPGTAASRLHQGHPRGSRALGQHARAGACARRRGCHPARRSRGPQVSSVSVSKAAPRPRSGSSRALRTSWPSPPPPRPCRGSRASELFITAPELSDSGSRTKTRMKYFLRKLKNGGARVFHATRKGADFFEEGTPVPARALRTLVSATRVR